MLLDLKEYSKSIAAFESGLVAYPNRVNAVIGAARSAKALGNKTGAQKYYSQLLKLCRRINISECTRQADFEEAQTFFSDSIMPVRPNNPTWTLFIIVVILAVIFGAAVASFITWRYLSRKYHLVDATDIRI